MDNYADISVLMSVYYKEKPEYFKESIDSVLNQTVKAKEIVLVKDGPLTDELNKVIDLCINEDAGLFKIISLKENVGLGRALAIGVENCNYDLIARMDTDDICREDRFEKQLIEFKNNQNLDIIGSDIIEFEESIYKPLDRRVVPHSHNEIHNRAKLRNPFNHMTVMYKKNSVIKVGNYRDAEGAEDYFLWARMLLNGCIARNLAYSLVYARIGEKMIERRGGIKYCISAIKIRREIYRLGFSNWVEFLFSSGLITFSSLIPSKIRSFFYRKFLRSGF